MVRTSRFQVGDWVRLNDKGLELYGVGHDLAKGVTVTETSFNSSGPYVVWHGDYCGGCHDEYLEPGEGPW